MDRVRREPSGRFRLRLRPNETSLMVALVEQLREQLSASTDRPTLRRLFPPAYPDDAEKDAGYQVLTRDELAERKLSALAVVESGLSQQGSATDTQLDEDQLSQWMLALNSIRLVLGTRLDVDEDTELDPDDPNAALYAVYEFLGWLLSQVVDALTEQLDED